MTTGSSTQAMMRTGPWHFSQVSMSILNTRFKRWAQVIAAWRWVKLRSSASFSLLAPLAPSCGCDQSWMFAIGSEHAVESSQIDTGFGHQGRQPGNEVQRLEDHMSSPIAERSLELVAHLAVGSQRQAFFCNGRPGDVATQAFQLLALMGLGRHPGMQAEAIKFGNAGLIACWFRLGREGLQGKHFAALLRADRDPVGNRMGVNIFKRIFFETVKSQVATVFVPLKNASTF